MFRTGDHRPSFEHARICRVLDLQLLSFFDGSIDSCEGVAQLIAGLRETGIAVQALITVYSLRTLASSTYLLSVVQCPVAAAI